MIMDGHWKTELHAYIWALKFWRNISKKVALPFVKHQISKYILYSGVLCRKLYEDQKNVEKAFVEHKWSLDHLGLLNLEIPALDYTYIGSGEYNSWQVDPEDYAVSPKEKLVQGKDICNQIIHSYVWELASVGGQLGFDGFLVSSNQKKSKDLYFVKIDDWIDYIQTCYEKCSLTK